MEILPHNKLLDLTGKTAIVTGGAIGIGYGISFRLAEAGANVVIAQRNREEAEKVASELKDKGFKVTAVECDVSKEDSVANLLNETLQAYGSVDILVNNAGIYPNIPMLKMTLADFEKVIHTNLVGVYLTTRHISEQMIKQGHGGKIINITSIDALHPSMVGLAHYDASKHGVWGFTKNVSIELADHKIWVNAIAPGGIVTPGVQSLNSSAAAVPAEEMQKRIAAFMQKIPMHRMGDPDEIGKAALFLASDMSSYMTGAQIVVDGGALMS
jgi:2-deoxy-D-gluconate 3-dehydrogenase